MKMSLLKDCIKVELQGDTPPDDIMVLEPYHFNRSRTILYFSLQKFPEVLRVFNKPVDKLPPNVRSIYDTICMRKSVTAALLAGESRYDISPVVSTTLTLRPHQQLARELALVNPKYAFYYDTRTGKTPTSIAIIKDDLTHNSKHKWLVVAPLILLELAWQADFEKFAPEISISVCHASTKKKRLERINADVSVYIINTESFVNYMEYFEGFDGVILDESSSMKNKSSKFSKAFVDYARHTERVYLLSGTPAPNGAHEYYRQIQAIDYYGIHQSFAQFKAKYFLNLARDVRFEDLVLRPDMADELQDLIKQYAIYVDKEDVLDTPGRTFIRREFSMPQNIKDTYKEMKSELAADIGGATILAPSAAAKVNKLNQLSSGFIIDTQAKKDNALEKTDKPEVYYLSDFRFTELLNLLDEIGPEQVIIWANYHAEFETIQKLLGNKCRTIYGDTSAASKVSNIKDFKEGRAQYLVANPASADKGLTLTNCHICIYFSLNWSYELFKQSMDRIYGDRSIQPYECIYYIMLAKGSMDKSLYKEVLLGKQELSYAVLNYLKADNDE